MNGIKKPAGEVPYPAKEHSTAAEILLGLPDLERDAVHEAAHSILHPNCRADVHAQSPLLSGLVKTRPRPGVTLSTRGISPPAGTALAPSAGPGRSRGASPYVARRTRLSPIRAAALVRGVRLPNEGALYAATSAIRRPEIRSRWPAKCDRCMPTPPFGPMHASQLWSRPWMACLLGCAALRLAATRPWNESSLRNRGEPQTISVDRGHGRHVLRRGVSKDQTAYE